MSRRAITVRSVRRSLGSGKPSGAILSIGLRTAAGSVFSRCALGEHLAPASLEDRSDVQPFADDIIGLERLERCPHHHDDVAATRPKLGRRAEGHADEPLGAISHHGAADFSRSRDAETCKTVRLRGRSQDQHEMSRGHAPPCALNAQELGALADSRSSRKPGSAAREHHDYFL